jgi:hypothetical protein
MRYQRLVLEYGALSFTLPLHQRLTVISGVGRQEREGLMGELLGALSGSRRGTRLEIVDDQGRRLGIERGERPEGDRVVELSTGNDVSSQFMGADGRIDVLGRLGLGAEEVRRISRLSAADVSAAGQGDTLIARLAKLDQRALWQAAERVQTSDEALRAEAEAVGASPEDAPIIEAVEERHAAFEAAQARHESVRHHGIFIGGASALGALPAAFLNRWTAVPFLVVAVLTTLVSISFRRRMEKARSGEQEALAAAGADSYIGFHIQRMNQLMESEQTRQRLADAAGEHRKAVAAWQAMAGDVPPGWALGVRDRITAAARRPADLHGEQDPTRAALAEPAELAQSLITRLAELRHAGTQGESVPLILDDPLAGMTTSVKQWMLELIGRSAGAPQVVYLTDDEDVAAWARIESLAGTLELIEPATAEVG